MIVALIGRPNVGKSTLFNRMISGGRQGQKVTAVTGETPGVTRDRNYASAEWEGRTFSVVDTGGFYSEDAAAQEGEIAAQMREQALCAVDEADVILHVMDGKDGLTPSDSELATFLRRSGKKVLSVVSKIDGPKQIDRMIDFYRLGVDDIVGVSGLTGFGFDDLMDELIEHSTVHAGSGVGESSDMPRVAVVGRPNVGKSTLINVLLSKKRLIVSSTPGTTRDAIDTVCTFYGRSYLFIDTAGIRRKVVSRSVEGFSVLRAIRSIERADVALIVLDATEGVVDQDQRIAGIVETAGKGSIFLWNKWDLISDPETAYKRLSKELKKKFWFMDYTPFLTTSGIAKKRVTVVFGLIDQVIAERRRRIADDELHDFLSHINARRLFPQVRGKDLQFTAMTQTGIEPPAFLIRVTHPGALRDSHRRQFEKEFRSRFSFRGTPVRLHFKSR